MPVSSNVSHHQYRIQTSVALSHKPDCWQLQLSITSGTGIRRQMTKPKLKINHASGTVQRCFTGSEVSQWLALRAGVLRRAVSQSGTALTRGALSAGSKLKLHLRSIVLEHRTSSFRCELTGRKHSLASKAPAGRSALSRSSQLISQLVTRANFKRRWLTNRSTGQFAAQVNWASFHSRPIALRRKLPVSSNVGPQRSPPLSHHRPLQCFALPSVTVKTKNLVPSASGAGTSSSSSSR